MHVRSVFRTAPDFKEISELSPDLQKHLIRVREDYYTINFKDPEALNALTCALASHYFNITLEIPLNRLIPTLPLRLNYLLWVEDLLSYYKTSDSCIGIDIGTGASAVYALLGYKNFTWHFLATESDTVCHEAAVKNVLINGLQDQITVKLVQKEEGKLAAHLGSDTSYSFSMCNPPFFEDTENMSGISRSHNRASPKSVCTATPNEVITSGGEEQFVGDIVDESLSLGTQVLWYTSMLGRRSSVEHILCKLEGCGVQRVAVTEFKQGNTTRWGVAWSLNPAIPPLLTPNSKKLSTIYSFTCNTSTIQHVTAAIRDTIAQLNMHFVDCPGERKDSELFCAWVTASRNTWSHGRRKRRREMVGRGGKRGCKYVGSAGKEKLSKTCDDENNEIDYSKNDVVSIKSNVEQSGSCLFYCLMSLEKTGSGVLAEFHWIFGSDKDSLNQFCCYLAKSITAINDSYG